MSHSAICTALSAAPFFIWSLTIQKVMPIGKVLANTAYIDVVAAFEEKGHGVFSLRRVVLELQTFAVAYSLVELLHADGFFGFSPDGLAVAAERGNTHAGGADIGISVHDFLGLVVHLHLFLGIAVVGEDVNLGDDIEGQLMGELLYGDRLSGKNLTVLFVEFGHGSGTCT